MANSEEGIGGTFQYRSYENAELVSSKQLTTFSDHRFPLSAPDHISLPQYVEYLQSYVDRFELAPFIKLGCPVTSIAPLEKSEKSQWKHCVKYVDRKNENKELSFDCSHVAICTGRTAYVIAGCYGRPHASVRPNSRSYNGDRRGFLTNTYVAGIRICAARTFTYCSLRRSNRLYFRNNRRDSK